MRGSDGYSLRQTRPPPGCTISSGTLEETPISRQRWFLIATALTFLNASLAAFAQQTPAPDNSTGLSPQPGQKPEWTAIPLQPRETPAPPPVNPSLPEIKYSNFASCPLAELQLAVPELEHLKPARDQSQLPALLKHIGAKTVDNVRNTPNLISHEDVILKLGGATTRQKFSFLILQHPLDAKSVVFDEYRVDLKNGEKIETDFEKLAPAESHTISTPDADVQPRFIPVPPPSSHTATLSQGFVNQWLYFYPTNQPDSEFRYLGEQIVDKRPTLVVAFAQRPGFVRLPATFLSDDTTYKIFMQGVAWIDPSDYRIVRLRTDLLSSPAGLRLRRLTVDIRFSQILLAEVSSPLWLPHQVLITATVGTSNLREDHTYTDYRLFRTRSKIKMR